MAARPRKDGSAKARRHMAKHGAVDLEQVPPYPYGSYMDFVLEHRAKNFRHWCAARSNGEIRSITDQFLELEREGKVGLYDHLHDLAQDVYGLIHPLFYRLPYGGKDSWNAMSHEHGKMVRAFASLGGGIAGMYGMPYGEIYHRAELPNNYVMVPHEVTAEEAEQRNAEERADAKAKVGWPPAVFVAGEIEFVRDKRPKEKVRTEWIGERWVDMFLAEVLHLLGSEPEPDHIAAFHDLHRNLKAFQIGNKEGAPVMERMRKEGNGVEVLDAFGRCRARLLKGLEQIAENIDPGTGAPLSTAPLFIWKGTSPDLFALFEELVGKGWIQVPANRGKRSRNQLARNVHAAFAYASGRSISVGTAVNYLKKGRDGVNEQRPVPRVPFVLKPNPDVGENYDPDKAEE